MPVCLCIDYWQMIKCVVLLDLRRKFVCCSSWCYHIIVINYNDVVMDIMKVTVR